MSDEHARDALAVALLSLMESKVPPHLLQLLVHGSLQEGIVPNALGMALAEAIRFTMRQAVEVSGRIEMFVPFGGFDAIRQISEAEAGDHACAAQGTAQIDNQAAQE